MPELGSIQNCCTTTSVKSRIFQLLMRIGRRRATGFSAMDFRQRPDFSGSSALPKFTRMLGNIAEIPLEVWQ
ncbi:unnamed protein product [Didymodactylos carnosus]|uniref:Uncharacterized protein n=1 Tax=Didymodactylos carnosus TaxID=1234261 RepID=A0A815J5B6_9BILA|nr:unnamed protein product [Didymodactylos carnosus]CAF4269831.1 unnamed protein product [Didymodactylos carnosus]